MTHSISTIGSLIADQASRNHCCNGDLDYFFLLESFRGNCMGSLFSYGSFAPTLSLR